MDDLKNTIRNLPAEQRRDLLAVLHETFASDHRRHLSDRDPCSVGAGYVTRMNELLGINILQEDRHFDWLWGRNCVIWKMTLDGFTEKQISEVVSLNLSTICNSRKNMKAVMQLPHAYPAVLDLWNKFNETI